MLSILPEKGRGQFFPDSKYFEPNQWQRLIPTHGAMASEDQEVADKDLFFVVDMSD